MFRLREAIRQFLAYLWPHGTAMPTICPWCQGEAPCGPGSCSPPSCPVKPLLEALRAEDIALLDSVRTQWVRQGPNGPTGLLLTPQDQWQFIPTHAIGANPPQKL